MTRTTYTDLENVLGAKIDDFWQDEGNRRPLSSSGTGRTVFNLLRPQAPLGDKWVELRLNKLQATTRPDNVWPEVWRSISKLQQKRQFRNGRTSVSELNATASSGESKISFLMKR